MLVWCVIKKLRINNKKVVESQEYFFRLLYQVCRRWSMCFELSKIWQNIVINDRWPRTVNRTVAEGNENEYSMQSLDYDQATKCLQQIGHFIQSIYIRPTQRFVKLYQFFVLLEWYFRNQVNESTH